MSVHGEERETNPTSNMQSMRGGRCNFQSEETTVPACFWVTELESENSVRFHSKHVG